MRDFRFASVIIAAAVLAGVAAFLFAYRLGPRKRLPSPVQQTQQKQSFAPPKQLARLLAPTTLNYYRVHVALDSTLRAGKQTFHLFAADVPGREGTCTYRDGRRWACGLRAYVALLNLIGSSAIECHPKDSDKPDVVICHKGNIDLSEWMLEHGWARLHPGVTNSRYLAAVRAAKAAKIGIWVEEPPPRQNATSK